MRLRAGLGKQGLGVARVASIATTIRFDFFAERVIVTGKGAFYRVRVAVTSKGAYCRLRTNSLRHRAEFPPSGKDGCFSHASMTLESKPHILSGNRVTGTWMYLMLSHLNRRERLRYDQPAGSVVGT